MHFLSSVPRPLAWRRRAEFRIPSSAFGTFSPLRRGEGRSQCISSRASPVRLRGEGALNSGTPHPPSALSPLCGGEKGARNAFPLERPPPACGEKARRIQEPLIRLRHLLPSAEGRRALAMHFLSSVPRPLAWRRRAEFRNPSSAFGTFSPLRRGEGRSHCIPTRPSPDRLRGEGALNSGTPHPPSAPSPLCGGEKGARNAFPLERPPPACVEKAR